jgi:hypothetical protein
MELENFGEELTLWFKPHSNWRSWLGVVSVQSPGSPTQDNFRTPLGSLRKKCHSDVPLVE